MRITKKQLKQIIKEELESLMDQPRNSTGEVLTEGLIDMFRNDTSYANQAIETMITAGMLPEPAEIEIDEDYQLIFLRFESEEELQQAESVLYDDLNIQKRRGGGWYARPRFWTGKHKSGGWYISIYVNPRENQGKSMRLTREQLRRIIIETIDEMRIDTVAGHAGNQGTSAPSHMTPEEFAEEYDLEVEIRPEDRMKVIYHWDDDAHRILARDVPPHWDSENAGQAEHRVYETNEYEEGYQK